MCYFDETIPPEVAHGVMCYFAMCYFHVLLLPGEVAHASGRESSVCYFSHVLLLDQLFPLQSSAWGQVAHGMCYFSEVAHVLLSESSACATFSMCYFCK